MSGLNPKETLAACTGSCGQLCCCVGAAVQHHRAEGARTAAVSAARSPAKVGIAYSCHALLLVAVYLIALGLQSDGLHALLQSGVQMVFEFHLVALDCASCSACSLTIGG